MKMKTNPIAICALVMLLLASCTESFKHKQEVAEKHLDEMTASSVTCGVLAETNNGESMSMTTFTYKDCSSHIADIEREWTVNAVAKSISEELTAKDLEGETHMKIIAETKAGETFTYLFALPDFKMTDELMKIADETLDACILDDHDAVNKLIDNSILPENAMEEIYYVTRYNDSIYEDQPLTTVTLGYHFADGTEDPDLKLFSVDYDVQGDVAHTTYTINVDRKTKKVVGIWLKTDPY